MNHIVKLPKPLAARLEKASLDQGVAPSTIARKAIAEHLRYLEWKERAITAGDADIAAGRLMTTEQVFAAVAKQRDRRAGKAKKGLEWSRRSAQGTLDIEGYIARDNQFPIEE